MVLRDQERHSLGNVVTADDGDLVPEHCAGEAAAVVKGTLHD
jgi:hypothetical protein